MISSYTAPVVPARDPGRIPNPLHDQVLPRPAVSTHERGWTRHPIEASDVFWAAAFFAITWIVRWPFIAVGQTMLHSDEAIVGLMAQDIAEGMRFPLYFYGQRYMGALEAYTIALLGPLFNDPITALRAGPTLFMALLASVQYLMLTRWFGRAGGVVGGLTLLAASPMFVQWSISARGGYIEILLWGSLLWWAYSEWFVEPLPATRRGLRKGVFGFLIGAGLWINPTIAVFVAPIIAHALLNRPLAAARASSSGGRLLGALDRVFPNVPMALPVLLLGLLSVVTGVWGVWVVDGEVRHSVMFNSFPAPVGKAVLLFVLGAAAVAALRAGWVRRLRGAIPTAGPFILGAMIGMTPILIYVVSRAAGGLGMDPSLPLGLRPIWTIGDPLVYLLTGIPLLLGADGTPFLDLVRVGRSYQTLPLGFEGAALMAGCNWIILGASLGLAAILVRQFGPRLGAALRLRPGVHPPIVFLLLALFAIPVMYVFGGCTIDFTTIRYMVPVWAVIPGILAAAVTCRRSVAPTRICIAALLLAWAGGQMGMFAQLGAPHPLKAIASSLRNHNVSFALAEPLDAHLLSFLTRQDPPIAEYQSFWPRLAHLREGQVEANQPIAYVVDTRNVNWTRDWERGGWPGASPPETSRFLWPALQRDLRENPNNLISRQPLGGGYELWRMRKPVPERSAA